MNEAVLLRNQTDADGKTFTTKLMYTQLSRKFGAFRPYFRFQDVRSPEGDPVNAFIGQYEGPSVGLRYDFSSYAAAKAQYNRIYQDSWILNGFNIQVAFTF